jgi:uncharacterized protein with HEPN domain
MRPDRLYLADIVAAADAIERFLSDAHDDSEFLTDELRQSAILQKLIVIGEAASRLSRELCAAHPEVMWADIIGFRNIAVHAYFNVNWQIVWVTATEDVPKLQAQVLKILDTLSEK